MDELSLLPEPKPFDFDEARRFIREDVSKSNGFPFDLYEDQLQALDEVFSCLGSGRYDNVIVVAPTGSGKSAIAAAIGMAARQQERKTMILVPTKNLQTQAINDFRGSIPYLRSFKGRSEYQCLLYAPGVFSTYTAEDAPCSEYDVAMDPYEDARSLEGLVAVPQNTDHPTTDALTTTHARAWVASDATRMDLVRMHVPKGKLFKSQHQIKICNEESMCPYRVARDLAEEAYIALMNMKGYFVWNTHALEAGYFRPREFTVFDECHLVEDYARDLYAVEATDYTLDALYERTLGKQRKLKRDADREWVNFREGKKPIDLIRDLYNLNARAIKKYMADFGFGENYEAFAEMAEEAGPKSDAAKLVRYHKVFKKAADAKASFARGILMPGVDKVSEPTLVVTPINLPDSFRDVYGLFNVFMSATVADIDVFCRSVNLDRTRTAIVRIPDRFPVEHRPIVPMPVTRVSTKAIEADAEGVYGPLAQALSDIAEHFPDQKALVHTSSYKFGAEIVKRVSSAVRARMLAPADGADNKEHLKTFLNVADKRPHILISPSVKEGVDLKNDLCRIQVFMKCPYLPSKDTLVQEKKRQPGGRRWVKSKEATTIRQQYGRTTRNRSDFSLTFFLDGFLMDFVRQHRGLFPQEFHQALELGGRLDWRQVSITHQLEIDGEKISY